MAAIDPSATPAHTGTLNGDTPARATLRVVYDSSAHRDDDESDLDSEEEAMQMQQLLGADSDDDEEGEESSSDDEEKNGGPSDPSKSKKARKEAAAAQLLKTMKQESSDEEMEDTSSSPVTNGLSSKKNKGKAKASMPEDQESSEEDLDDDAGGLEELVLCTLDPNQHYQQPLNITIPEGQATFFKVSGTHAVYLTGNYVVAPDEPHDHDEGDSDYDMSPDEDELEAALEDEESDELDNLEDPRITEVGSEDDEAPKLVKDDVTDKVAGKGKNKRAAEELDEEAATLDAIMDKSLKPAEPAAPTEPKLSKKQMKKLKNNAGKAVEAAIENKDVKKDDHSTAKGPSGAKKEAKANAKSQSKEDAKAGKKENANEKLKATLGPKTLPDGVIIDDKKLGTGPACKKGNKVAMRYIGKLENSKVFDANKKGPPFTFTLGGGEVIKGWDSGIPGMSVGGERRVTVPAKLAYGSKGTGGIPPNSNLIFDVKLLNIV
ncbi:hypothetical protein G7Y79_00015g039990 [Physcia stellaris]|nr:hypothetical protein G7Y79_00015g039990 [Physcia stellaris]